MVHARETVLNMLRSPWLALAFRLYLGGVFIYASINKISYAGEFAETIASYQMVPYFLVNITAVILPWLELITGIMLVAGIRVRAACVVLGSLLAAFSVAVAVNLIRGTDIGCGCFRSLEEPMSWATFFRDIAWLAMAAHVYFFDTRLQLERQFTVELGEAES